MAANPEFKRNVIQAFLAHFEKELAALLQSAKAAHEAATHEESRAEDRHDTFAIELSYLAQGQSVRVQELRKSLTELNQLLEKAASGFEPRTVAVGNLVTLESAGKRTQSLIAYYGGGTQVKVAEQTISLLSPSSPLGDNVMELALGDSFAIDTPSGERELTVVSIL